MRIELLAITFLALLGCKKDDSPDTSVPACINNKIAELQAATVRNPPASIWQYQYKGKTVYYIPSYCCDAPSELFDSECNFICSPDGGITGKGDYQCPDFADTRTNDKLIWKDNRE